MQAERQEASASTGAADESSIRRSIQAELDKKAKEEKLGLIKRTLQVGKRAVSCYMIALCLYCGDNGTALIPWMQLGQGLLMFVVADVAACKSRYKLAYTALCRVSGSQLQST